MIIIIFAEIFFVCFMKDKIYKQGSLLAKINSPSDLRKLKKDELDNLAQQIREYIVDIVSEKGGISVQVLVLLNLQLRYITFLILRMIS